MTFVHPPPIAFRVKKCVDARIRTVESRLAGRDSSFRDFARRPRWRAGARESEALARARCARWCGAVRAWGGVRSVFVNGELQGAVVRARASVGGRASREIYSPIAVWRGRLRIGIRACGNASTGGGAREKR